jgi:hypothetical protein
MHNIVGKMGFSNLAIRFLVLLSIAVFTVSSNADEVIIDSKATSKVSVGDFDCSKCPTAINNILELFDGIDNEVTAGQLWSFFDAQGVSSVDHLVLCLDVQPTDDSAFGINSVELKIEDPAQMGSLLTNVSLGDNSLVLPGYDITAFKPEAKLEIALGYDFMERFSANSTELISLDVSSDGANASTIVSVQGESGFFAQGFNLFALGIFAIFWAIVFLVLNRFTKPQVGTGEVLSPNPATANRQALSA